MLAMLILTGWGQQGEKKHYILPGNGKIDVEMLNKKIDLNMDISQLNINELRVLRNSFYARQGYAFMTSDMRSVFYQASWYYDKMMERWEIEEEAAYNGQEAPAYKFTKEEEAFMAKLKAREDELKKHNFANGQPVLDNLVNNFQIENPDKGLTDMLANQGFAIVPDTYEQLFQVYENNDYHDFPSFVTTDLYLQLYHMYFDCMLRRAEEGKLFTALQDFCRKAYEKCTRAIAHPVNAQEKELAEFNQAYFAVALRLLNPQENCAVEPKYKSMVIDEVAKCNAANTDFSPFLEYTGVMFPYALFRPRGHYTRSETLKRYFRGMMWVQTAAFDTDNPLMMRRAVFMAKTICGNAELNAAFKDIFDPMTFIMGNPDNITMMQVYEILQHYNYTELIGNDNVLQKFVAEVDAQAEKQTRIRPKQELSGHNKINLMPQRYQPDGEVLQEMYDWKSNVSQRFCPKGIDFFAAGGSALALQLDREGETWTEFDVNMERMQKRMGEIDWKENIAVRWQKVLLELSKGHQQTQVPYFMVGTAWGKKDLNAALASYAELKHDAILYAKQPFAAECGGGGPEDPIVKGYVEPNIGFWTAVIDLLNVTKDAFKSFGIMNDEILALTDDMVEEAQFFLNCSRKELVGKQLSNDEYRHIEIVGSVFENMTLNLISNGDEYLMNWNESVSGADRSVAVVADIYTANGRNVPSEKRAVLYNAVGPSDVIYVIVEINGYLYLTRGAVFSYREFHDALNVPRHTDEEWQEMLKTKPRLGVPQWMESITVPIKAPKDNDLIFYSSGC